MKIVPIVARKAIKMPIVLIWAISVNASISVISLFDTTIRNTHITTKYKKIKLSKFAIIQAGKVCFVLIVLYFVLVNITYKTFN